LFISKRMGYPRISHMISVLQADNIPCFYQSLSCGSTADLADKGTLSLVGTGILHDHMQHINVVSNDCAPNPWLAAASTAAAYC
jgi:hypothetical protein